MAVRRIQLTQVNYKDHKCGSIIKVGKDIPKGGADYLVKSGDAEEVIESKPDGGK